jgi:hypothetical protein
MKTRVKRGDVGASREGTAPGPPDHRPLAPPVISATASGPPSSSISCQEKGKPGCWRAVAGYRTPHRSLCGCCSPMAESCHSKPGMRPHLVQKVGRQLQRIKLGREHSRQNGRRGMLVGRGLPARGAAGSSVPKRWSSPEPGPNATHTCSMISCLRPIASGTGRGSSPAAAPVKSHGQAVECEGPQPLRRHSSNRAPARRL